MSTGKRLPGPTLTLPILNLHGFKRDKIAFLARWAAKYGDISSLTLGFHRIIFINGPHYIQQVLIDQQEFFHKGRGLERARRVLGNGLLTVEDEAHLKQRRLIQPAFHRERIASYGSIATLAAFNLQKDWKSGQTVDISAEMFRLTLGIIGKTLFGVNLEHNAPDIAEIWQDIITQFDNTLLALNPLVDLLPLPSNFRMRSSLKRLDAIIYRLIYEHEKTGGNSTDLLGMLLSVRDENDRGRKLMPRQVRDEALTIMMAGHETTANALSWTWVLLAQHPEVLEKLQSEIAFIVGERLPTYEDLPKLKYARQILSESMRLFPPAWAIGRRATAAVEIGEYKIRKGTVVLMSPAVTHRDPRWYPEPDRFDPDRWLPGSDELRPRFAYYPFGGGPRTCIGEQFAWMEMILLLVSIAQRWTLTLAPDAIVELDPVITLRPKAGLWMNLKSRAIGPTPQYTTL